MQHSIYFTCFWDSNVQAEVVNLGFLFFWSAREQNRLFNLQLLESDS